MASSAKVPAVYVQVEAAITDMDRIETLLLGLQNAVNALLDSTTADGNTANATPVRLSLSNAWALLQQHQQPDIEKAHIFFSAVVLSFVPPFFYSRHVARSSH